MVTKLPKAEIGGTYTEPVELPLWDTYVDLIDQIPWPHVATALADREANFGNQDHEIQVAVRVTQLQKGVNVYCYHIMLVDWRPKEIIAHYGQIIGEIVPMRIIGTEAELRKAMRGKVTGLKMGL